MIPGQLSYAIWLSLPPELRHKLVTLFDMPRSGRTVVEYRATGATVTSDGYTPADLQHVSLDRMQAILGDDSDNYYKLFEVVVDNIDALLGGTFVPLAPNSGGPAPEERVESVTVTSSTNETSPTYTSISTGKTPFCDSCDSKGVRHKKVCPKYK